jgi:hypothetical protein
MIAAVVLRNGHRTKLDYEFMFDEKDGDGELRFAKINPVKVLHEFADNAKLTNIAREIWLGDWVLDCDSLTVNLHTDYTTRSPRKRSA